MNRNIVLFEDEGFRNLLPLAHWRAVFELRVGRKLLLDRIAQHLGSPIAGFWTRDEYKVVVSQRCGAPANQPITEGAVLVNGRWLLNQTVEIPQTACVGTVGNDIAYIVCDARLARGLSPSVLLNAVERTQALEGVERKAASGCLLSYPWEVVTRLSELLEEDWSESDAGIDTDLDPGVLVPSPERLHVGERTVIHPSAVLDTAEGAIFISHDVKIGPYAVIEAPAYIGPGCRIRAHAHLHSGNAIGPVCRIGGEVCGSVIQDYTNKQHLGFLGHAFVGSWVNIGAGATNSNLKNTYGPVRVPVNGADVDTGLQFFGAIIGDHAKIGINVAIPTGAVVGMASCVAATNKMPKYLPSFSWFTESGLTRGDPLRLLDVATAAMARRDVDMTDAEVELMTLLGERAEGLERDP